jgi:hypothetical protein
MHFGENQLSPLSIGISPLPTAHPSGLQSTPVRASMSCYRHFTLAMGSSSGFGSTPCDMRAIHTRFRCGSGCNCLNRPQRVTRRIILQKARRQPALNEPRPSTAWKRTVSGSISLPSPGCFSPFPHGTMRYRSLRVSNLGRWSPQLHTGLLVSGATQEPGLVERAGLLPGYHGLRRRFPDVFAYAVPGQWCVAAHPAWSYNPVVATPAGLTPPRFRQLPVRSPLLRGYFHFLGILRCFSSPGALRRSTVTSLRWLGCPIRRSRDHGLLTAPPRLSQLCHVLLRHAAPRHPPYAHCVFPDERPVVNARRS